MPNHVFNGNMPINLSNSQYLRRDDINNLLEKSLQKPLTIVVAGAGYGKTQTVYSFLQEHDAMTIWMKLTVLDNIGSRMWNNMVNGISLNNMVSAFRLNALEFPDTAAKFDIFLSCASDIMVPGRKYVIVFDDFHLIHEKKIFRFIEMFSNACLPDCPIILISRCEPDINTAGLYDKGLLSMIREEDLRFSKNDMIRYYEFMNIHISRQVMSKIYKNTNGWIMAIRLVGLSIQKGVEHEDYAITAMKQNIFKLIDSEVYSAIPQDVQKFLVKLSLFNSLPLELVELLASNDERLITAILKINSFTHYDSFSNLYCIHHLFLDFLAQKQNTLKQKEKEECYRKAADWFISNGYRIDAITYYEKAGDYDKILKIALIIPHASPEEAVLVLEILDNAPKATYEQEPLLAVLHARAQWIAGERKEYRAELEALIKKYAALPQTRENLLILCELYFNLGLSGYYLACTDADDYNFPQFFRRACQCMPEEGTLLTARFMQDVGSYVCRISSEKKEDMDKYVEAVDTAAFYAPQVMRGAWCGLDDLTHAELEYFKNNMKSSEKLAYQAFYKARQARQYMIEIRAIFYLIRIALAAGDYAKILALIKLLETEKLPNSQTLYDIVAGWLYSVIGQGGKSASWIKSSLLHEDLGVIASGVENLAKIKYCLSEKKYHDFLIFWESQKKDYSINGINAFLFGRIAMMATKAVSLYNTDEKGEAIEALQEAYYLAEPNSLTMQFIELGNDMISLARFALKSGDCEIPSDWLSSIFKKSSTYAKRLSHVASEYKRANRSGTDLQPNLTKRELEFLNETCRGLSRAEIAMHYGISPNYVKNKLQTIYAKLGAENPMDAIRIAALTGLIK